MKKLSGTHTLNVTHTDGFKNTVTVSAETLYGYLVSRGVSATHAPSCACGHAARTYRRNVQQQSNAEGRRVARGYQSRQFA